MAPKSKPKPSTSKSKSKPKTQETTTTTQRPNWPTLSPLLPTPSLSITTLLPSQILLIPNLFTPTLCQIYTTFLSTLPLTTTPNTPQRGHATRVNDRFQTHDPTFAHALWTQTSLQALVTNFPEAPWAGEVVLGLNPNIRVYRYRPGHFFDRHYDDSNRLDWGGEQSPTPTPAKTTWTLLIYLSTCEGGETAFYPEASSRKAPTPEAVVVEVKAGLALLHRHGEDCLLHEGREVKAGEKWVLRSDLVVKR